jgi:hypothetical protein
MIKPHFIFLSLVFSMSAFATSTQIMTIEDVQYNPHDKTVVEFVVNRSREISVQARLMKYKMTRRPGYRTIRSQTASIRGLMINDNNEIKFGDVVCGTVKFRRIFGPKIMPSGKCTLTSQKAFTYHRYMGPREHIEVFVVTE